MVTIFEYVCVGWQIANKPQCHGGIYVEVEEGIFVGRGYLTMALPPATKNKQGGSLYLKKKKKKLKTGHSFYE